MVHGHSGKHTVVHLTKSQASLLHTVVCTVLPTNRSLFRPHTPRHSQPSPLTVWGGVWHPQAAPRPPARGQTVAGVRRSPIPGLSVTRVGHSPARWMSRTVRRLQSDFRSGFSRAHGTPNNKTDSQRTAGLAAVFSSLFTKCGRPTTPTSHVASPKVTSIKKYTEKSHVGSPAPSTTTKR